MKIATTLAFLLVPVLVYAAGMECTIRVPADNPPARLESMAKITEPQAKQYALQALKAPRSAYAEGELEVEQGCLVYSFDVKMPGKSGVEEVIIDAGDGTILMRKHESTKEEQAEHPKQKPTKK